MRSYPKTWLWILCFNNTEVHEFLKVLCSQEQLKCVLMEKTARLLLAELHWKKFVHVELDSVSIEVDAFLFQKEWDLLCFSFQNWKRVSYRF